MLMNIRAERSALRYKLQRIGEKMKMAGRGQHKRLGCCLCLFLKQENGVD